MSEVHITDNSQLTLDELERKKELILEQWGLTAERHAKRDEITPKVYDIPQSETYKRTGRLRGSITYATKKYHSPVEPPFNGGKANPKDGITEKQVPDDNTVVVGTNVEYAAYVELGTSKMRPRPFIEPSVANYIDEYKKNLHNYLTQ